MAEVKLEPKQEKAFLSEATEVLYGGAAGGGKSYLMRVSAIRWCAEVPGIQVYLFRRTLPDLRDNHLRGPTSFHVMLMDYIQSGHVKYRSVENEFEFWNKSVLHLCYCDSENDVEKYRGAEIHVLMPDELTHFSDYQYRFLRSRVRIAGLKIPPQYKSRLPRIEAASNPGSIGHAWVKRSFITPKPEGEIWKASPDEGGMYRQFISAKLSDNPYLTRDDPSYADRLRGLGADTLVRAMLDGDWDIIAGQAFEKLRKETHCIDPFDPPSDWLCFGSFDWGSTRPFSYGMWCVSNGDQLPDGRVYPKGALIRFDEYYGWNGKPNEGLRMEVSEVAEEILKLENGRHMGYRIADSSIWTVNGGPSIAEGFNKARVIFRPAPKGPGSRHNGYVEVRSRINGGDEGPMLYATKNCHDGFWRTMPDLIMDEHKYGINSEQIECWVADTMIATKNGDKRIEDVKEGDLVHTPIGLRKVTKKYISGKSETCWAILSNGKKIEGTPNHKIYIEEYGLVPLEQVECGDILIERSTKWKENLLFIKVLNTTLINKVNTMRQEFLCTARYGLSIMGQYLKNTTYTIKMVTLQIIGLRILNVSLQQNTHYTIAIQDHYSEKTRGNGQVQMKVKQYLEKQWKNVKQIIQKKNLRAEIVENLLKQNYHSKNTAQHNAKKNTIGLLKHARYVMNLLKPKDTRREKCKPVHIIAVGRSEEKKEVYNLTVDEAHLFYADGILSSNTNQEDHCSDETMYACVSRPWVRAVEKKKEPVDRWMRLFDTTPERSWRTV